MKKLILLLLPVLFFSAGCCKSGKKSCCNKAKGNCAANTTCSTPESITAALPGEWTWIKTNCCGRTATWKTPETEGYSASLLFTKEKAEHLRNGKSQSNAPYSITYFEEGAKDKIAYTESEGRKAMITLRNDTLILDYGYMDLQTEFYVRKK